MGLEGAVFLLSVFLPASLLRNFSLLCFQLIFEVCRVILIVLWGVLRHLGFEIFLASKVHLRFESVLLRLLLLILLPQLLFALDSLVVLRSLND